MSNFFVCDFWQNEDFKKSRKPQKASKIKTYLLASSIATRAATVIQQPLGCLTIGVVICAEHIVCVFSENIISHFDVSVNDVAKEFAEMLRIGSLARFYLFFFCFNLIIKQKRAN